VEHQFGGVQSKEKAEWMTGVVENFFYENDNLISEEVADYIGEMLDNEFNSICEDGSLEELSNKLCCFFNAINNGKEDEVIADLEKIKSNDAVSKSKKGPKPKAVDEVDLLTEDLGNAALGSSQESVRKPRNEPDEDGWITVGKK